MRMSDKRSDRALLLCADRVAAVPTPRAPHSQRSVAPLPFMPLMASSADVSSAVLQLPRPIGLAAGRTVSAFCPSADIDGLGIFATIAVAHLIAAPRRDHARIAA